MDCRLQDKTPELYENAMAMLNLCEAAMAALQNEPDACFARGLAHCVVQPR